MASAHNTSTKTISLPHIDLNTEVPTMFSYKKKLNENKYFITQTSKIKKKSMIISILYCVFIIYYLLLLYIIIFLCIIIIIRYINCNLLFLMLRYVYFIL